MERSFYNPYHAEKLAEAHFFVNSFLPTFFSRLGLILIQVPHVLLVTPRYDKVKKREILWTRCNYLFVMANKIKQSCLVREKELE